VRFVRSEQSNKKKKAIVDGSACFSCEKPTDSPASRTWLIAFSSNSFAGRALQPVGRVSSARVSTVAAFSAHIFRAPQIGETEIVSSARAKRANRHRQWSLHTQNSFFGSLGTKPKFQVSLSTDGTSTWSNARDFSTTSSIEIIFQRSYCNCHKRDRFADRQKLESPDLRRAIPSLAPPRSGSPTGPLSASTLQRGRTTRPHDDMPDCLKHDSFAPPRLI